METLQIQMNLNHKPTEIRYAPGTTLLQYLRGTACLKGAKEGCGTGHCGACTVLADGKPVRACITKLDKLNGKEVLTIEGLAPEGSLHPIQKAYLQVGAIQCGFCTPGMIMATKALLDRDPHPSREAIMQALKHNYCRCTGYVKIIEAVELAAQWLSAGEEATEEESRPALESTYIFRQTDAQPAPVLTPSELAVVGHPIWDADGPAKASGALPYADDLELPGMLYGSLVWSAYPHAKIVSIDPAPALEDPQVVRVLTHLDIPGVNGFGLLKPDQPVFCKDEVRFMRDMVGLAVAETPAAARRAAARVKVEYELLTPVFNMEEAAAQGMILKELTHEVGDLTQARQEKNLLVLKGHFETPWVEHAYLEPESALAHWDEESGLTLQAPTQSPFELRRQLAAILNLPQEKIRVIVTPLGGGFGSKADATVEPAAAVAAWCLKRPVKITLTREESLGISTKRHPYHMDYEVGLDSDGVLRYYEAYLISDGGPYTNLSARVIDQACIFSVGPYRIPNGRVHGVAATTNNVPCSAFRGFGINQVAVAMESLLDEAARKLKLDPFELRMRNALKPGDATLSGEILQKSIGIRDTIQLCRVATAKAAEEYQSHYPQGTKVLGIGMASGFKNVGAGKGKVDDAGAIITQKSNGRLELRVSGVDMGQGFRTAMLQLAAEALDMDPGQIDLVSGDTELTPHHGNAVGERQTLISGNAVVQAAKLFKEKLANHPAGQLLSVRYDYVAPKTFALYDVDGRKSVSAEEYRNYPAYAYTTQSALIEADTATGKIRVLKVIAAHDVGRAINPHIIEGQIEGSCSMGIGYALSEAFPMEEGKPKVAYYGKLGLPTIEDTPAYEHLLLEDPEPQGPFGAKGVSEVATVPMTPAVLNAIYDALGIRIHSLPATPDKILKALADQEKKR
jgi:CO/xanthine dehydrogenase Mo-binding subunit/aerobic-type carbon monoxide dehydrogenase small subunit (CoxS/CutS family)